MEHYTEFSINAGFNIQFDRKDNVTLQFSITLSLMVILFQQIGLKLSLHFDCHFPGERQCQYLP